MQKPTYHVQGYKFTLKPTTPKNRRLVGEHFTAHRNKAEAFLEAMEKGENVENIMDRPDDDRMWFELFKLITEGPHDSLDFEEFDQKVGEVALSDFLPSAAVTALRQIGYLPFPAV